MWARVLSSLVSMPMKFKPYGMLTATFMAFFLGSLGCGGNGGTTTPGPSGNPVPSTPGPSGNPVPSITSISPSSTEVRGGDFTLTVTGSGFISSSVVRWNGDNRTTAFVSSTQLDASIVASDIGSASTTQTTVFNPSPGGGISNARTFSIIFSNASLNGQYAFGFSGVDTNGLFLASGSFTADGNGNLTGIEDLNEFTGVFQNLSFTGSYSVGADGRGSASITTSQGTSNIRFVLLSPDGGLLIQFDTFAVGNGVIEKQDASAFSNSALNGGYSFGFDGISSSGAMSAAGRFTADGAGNISAGVEDINDAGVVSTNIGFTGTYSVASNGRGTATFTSSLGTSQFSFYVVSASKAHFVSLDFVPAVIGAAEGQQGSFFSNSSVSGDYALLFGEVSTSGTVVSAGRLTADGFGGISAGVIDENDAGTVSGNIAFTGTYHVSSNGRGTAILTLPSGDSNFAFYVVSPGRVLFVQTDSFATTSGALDVQQGGPFSTASISGNFGFLLSGETSNGATAISGQLIADGAGNLTATEDVNEAGILTSGVALDGTYTIASNGRGSATIMGTGVTTQLRFYLVSPSRVNLVGVDSSQIFLGIAVKQ